MCRDGRPEASSEHDDAMRIDVVALDDRIVDRQPVGDELRLAGLSLARAVAAIVDADDRPLARPARIGDRPRDLLRVASEIDDGRRRRGRALDDPAAKMGAVGGNYLER